MALHQMTRRGSIPLIALTLCLCTLEWLKLRLLYSRDKLCCIAKIILQEWRLTSPSHLWQDTSYKKYEAAKLNISISKIMYLHKVYLYRCFLFNYQYLLLGILTLLTHLQLWWPHGTLHGTLICQCCRDYCLCLPVYSFQN